MRNLPHKIISFLDSRKSLTKVSPVKAMAIADGSNRHQKSKGPLKDTVSYIFRHFIVFVLIAPKTSVLHLCKVKYKFNFKFSMIFKVH